MGAELSRADGRRLPILAEFRRKIPRSARPPAPAGRGAPCVPRQSMIFSRQSGNAWKRALNSSSGISPAICASVGELAASTCSTFALTLRHTAITSSSRYSVGPRSLCAGSASSMKRPSPSGFDQCCARNFARRRVKPRIGLDQAGGDVVERRVALQTAADRAVRRASCAGAWALAPSATARARSPPGRPPVAPAPAARPHTGRRCSRPCCGRPDSLRRSARSGRAARRDRRDSPGIQ